MQDGVQTAQASKFVYQLWRPVTAIQRAGEDLNPATDADPTWMPLLTTPPYPSYAGNMACIGASSARALALYFGTNDMPGVRAMVQHRWHQLRGPLIPRLLADGGTPGREPRIRRHPLSLRHHGEPGSLPEGGRRTSSATTCGRNAIELTDPAKTWRRHSSRRGGAFFSFSPWGVSVRNSPTPAARRNSRARCWPCAAT